MWPVVKKWYNRNNSQARYGELRMLLMPNLCPLKVFHRGIPNDTHAQCCTTLASSFGVKFVCMLRSLPPFLMAKMMFASVTCVGVIGSFGDPCNDCFCQWFMMACAIVDENCESHSVLRNPHLHQPCSVHHPKDCSAFVENSGSSWEQSRDTLQSQPLARKDVQAEVGPMRGQQVAPSQSCQMACHL